MFFCVQTAVTNVYVLCLFFVFTVAGAAIVLALCFMYFNIVSLQALFLFTRTVVTRTNVRINVDYNTRRQVTQTQGHDDAYDHACPQKSGGWSVGDVPGLNHAAIPPSFPQQILRAAATSCGRFCTSTPLREAATSFTTQALPCGRL